jgi:hypothetical protein
MPGVAACCTRQADAPGSATDGPARHLPSGGVRDQRREHRPTTVRSELARGGHFEWPGGHPSDKELQVPCSSELETMLHLARGAPRRGYASRPRPTVEVRRPSARDRQSFGSARAGDTRSNRRASRRVRESTAAGLVPPPVNPECTSTALRRGHRDTDRTPLSGTATAFGSGWSPEPGPGSGFWICGSGSHPSGGERAKRRSSPQLAQASCTNECDGQRAPMGHRHLGPR